MRNASYRMKKGVNEIWKKKETATINDQRTKLKKPEHSQIWIAKTEQVNRSLEDETSNKEYSQNKNKEAYGAHNNDVDDESPMVEKAQEELSDDYLINLPILF
jgi:hypothetical protein